MKKKPSFLYGSTSVTFLLLHGDKGILLFRVFRNSPGVCSWYSVAARRCVLFHLPGPFHLPSLWHLPSLCLQDAGGGRAGPGKTLEIEIAQRWLARTHAFSISAPYYVPRTDALIIDTIIIPHPTSTWGLIMVHVFLYSRLVRPDPVSIRISRIPRSREPSVFFPRMRMRVRKWARACAKGTYSADRPADPVHAH